MARLENTNSESFAAMPHIMVVDDDARIRSLVTRYLSEHDFIVLAAANAAEAREVLAAADVDLAVVDVMMPGESGVELTRALRANDVDLPVLMLTALGEADDRIDGLEAGADDYLAKPFEPRELILRINAMLRRTMKMQSDDRLYSVGAVKVDLKAGYIAGADGQETALTEAESLMLGAMFKKPGQIFSREELSEICDVSSGRAIDVLVTRLRRKLEADSKNPRYLQTVRGQGYVLRV
jgi:two-component system phosphate regulon response regulator OmpR